MLLIVGALAAAGLLIKEYWGEIKAFFAGFWTGFLSQTDGIKNAFARVRDEITRVIDKLGLFKKEAQDAEDASEDAGNSIGKFFGQTLAVVLDALAALIRGVTDLALGLWAVLKFIGVPGAVLLIWDALLVVKNGVEALITGVWWLIDAFLWAESAIMRALDNVWYAIVDFFTIDLYENGLAMIRSFIDGFVAGQQELSAVIEGALDDAMEYLPFSDAKRGPFRNLTESGRAIMETLTSGLRSAGNLPLADALLPVGPVPAAVGAGVGIGGGVTLTLSIGELNVTATNADPQEIARAIAGDELARQIRALVEQVDSRVRV